MPAFPKMILTAAFVSGFLGAPAARAAELTLKQALDQAAESSPKVQRARSAAEEVSWRRVEAAATYWPTLQGGVNYLTDKKYVMTDIEFGGNPMSIPGIVPTTTFSLTAQYALFDGFASTNRYRAASTMEDSARHEYDWARFQSDRETELQFYRALAAKTLKEVADANIKTLEDHLKDVNLFKKAGVSTNYDVLRVEVQVSEARSELLNSTDNIEIAKGRLAELLGSEEAADVVGALPVPEPSMIAALDAGAVEDRRDLVALRERASALSLQESAAGRHWVPRVSAFGTYQSYNNRTDRFDDSENFREAYQVGLNLTWNLFEGFSSVAKSREAVEQRFQAEKSLQIARLRAKQDFELWKRKFSYYCAVYKARVNDVAKSRESVRLAREGQRVGVRTNTDLLDAEAELFRAQAGAVNAQIGAVEALVNLELSTGQKLYEFQ